MINFRSFNNLHQTIKENISKIPKDIDLVVGIPRSGLLVANLISLSINKPLVDLDGFTKGKIFGGGLRLSKKLLNFTKIKKVLVIDDSLNSGASLEEAKEKIRKSNIDKEIIYGIVYLKPGQEDKVDIYFEHCSMPRVFEWNLFHHDILNRSCVDIDGILCRDPSNKENDDGKRYLHFIKNVKPKISPTVEISHLVTCRLEKYRGETIDWLNKNNIKYKNLEMMQYKTKEERIRDGNHAKFKAEKYLESNTDLFIESNSIQAKEIFNLTKKDVYSFEDSTMFTDIKPINLDNSLSLLQPSFNQIYEKISKQFIESTGYKLNVNSPKTFNEKIQWLKLYYRDPLLTLCSDKYLVRDYVSKKIGSKYLVPLIGVYDNENEINFEKLPNKFIIKLNNGSGKNIICHDKNNLNIFEAKSKLHDWLKPESSHYLYSYEWAYKDIKPKIICETYLETKNRDLFDYKFMCFHGKPELLWIDSRRHKKHQRNFFDMNWKEQNIFLNYPKNKLLKISETESLAAMKELAIKLSNDFPHVRVDFYLVDNQIYFGELTFYSANGMGKFIPKFWDRKLGNMLNLNLISDGKIQKNITISFFSHSSQLGGGEKSMLELIQELKEKQIFSHVIIPEEGPIQEELEKNLIPYDIVKLNWWATTTSKGQSEIIYSKTESFKNLIDYLPKLALINPDLIYTNTMVIPWGAIAANYLNKPHLWHIREFGELDHKLSFELPYSKIVEFIEKNSDELIFNSKAVLKYFSKYLSKIKTNVAYNYIEIDSKLSNEFVISPFKIKNSLKILVCGSLQEGKNQLEAIKTVVDLFKDGHSVELLLLGSISDQDYFNELNQYIKDHSAQKYIHILSFTKNPYPYFMLTDVVLVTSNKEAFGRTIIEGMILNKPVVTSKEGGTSEIIKNNINGFTYSVGDINELKKILISLKDKKIQNKIAITGHQSLKNINSKDRYGYKIAKIIRNQIKDYRSHKKLSESSLKPLRINLHQIENENKVLNKEIKTLKDSITKNQNEINKITTSKYYNIWRGYCQVKDYFKK